MKKFYYRTKLKLWAIFHLPRFIYIADTNFKIPAWNWQVAIPCRTETTKVANGRMDYEPKEKPYFENILKGKKVFFDIGANIGYYSFLAAAGGAEKIVAFEFMKEYADFAESAFAMNNIPAIVVKRGVGNPGGGEKYSDPLASTEGNTISLDEFAERSGIYPDIMKMDIEGFELDALKNAKKILSRRPDLDISIHPEFLKRRGHSEEEVLSLLSGYGYKIIWNGGGTYFMTASQP